MIKIDLPIARLRKADVIANVVSDLEGYNVNEIRLVSQFETVWVDSLSDPDIDMTVPRLFTMIDVLCDISYDLNFAYQHASDLSLESLWREHASTAANSMLGIAHAAKVPFSSLFPPPNTANNTDDRPFTAVSRPQLGSKVMLHTRSRESALRAAAMRFVTGKYELHTVFNKVISLLNGCYLPPAALIAFRGVAACEDEECDKLVSKMVTTFITIMENLNSQINR